MEYLDSIFCLPENIEDGSKEEAEYMTALGNITNVYGGLSVEQEVIEKIKEILDYLNGEE